MKTNKILIQNDGTGLELALKEAESYAEFKELNARDSVHLRLMAEEVLGMVRAIMGNFSAIFAIEDEDGLTKVCLTAKTEMNYEKKENLLAASTSGKNEAAKGFMGKIRDFVEDIMYPPTESENAVIQNQMMYASYGMMSSGASAGASRPMWSLAQYRTDVESAKDGEEQAKKDWDELEKSIIANIADDIKVWVKEDTLRLVIEKRF